MIILFSTVSAALALTAMLAQHAFFANSRLAIFVILLCTFSLLAVEYSHQTSVNQFAIPRKKPNLINNFWVVSDNLNRRTCPSTQCGIVGQFSFQEKIKIFETREGWARVTKYYNAGCEGGKSIYVDFGESNCLPNNGIINNRFAEWVFMHFLSGKPSSENERTHRDFGLLIVKSDDYKYYRKAFIRSAKKLITAGRCNASDFLESGGWTKSIKFRKEPIYFTYCGEAKISNRLYLNVKTGKIFK